MFCGFSPQVFFHHCRRFPTALLRRHQNSTFFYFFSPSFCLCFQRDEVWRWSCRSPNRKPLFSSLCPSQLASSLPAHRRLHQWQSHPTILVCVHFHRRVLTTAYGCGISLLTGSSQQRLYTIVFCPVVPSAFTCLFISDVTPPPRTYKVADTKQNNSKLARWNLKAEVQFLAED